MTTQQGTTSAGRSGQGPPMVQPGGRAVLLSHHEYRQVRLLGQNLENYDLLMRRPAETESEDGSDSQERWLPAPANKYLKHRAGGWREAGSLSELPEEWRGQALDRGAFPTEGSVEDEGTEE